MSADPHGVVDGGNPTGATGHEWVTALLDAQPFLPPMTDTEMAALRERIAAQTTPEVQRG